jgi:hypothetical protein
MLSAWRPAFPSKFLADASRTGTWSVQDTHDLGGIPPIIRDQPAHAIEALTLYDLRDRRGELDCVLQRRGLDKSMRVLLYGKLTAVIVDREERVRIRQGSGGDPTR